MKNVENSKAGSNPNKAENPKGKDESIIVSKKNAFSVALLLVRVALYAFKKIRGKE